ncbi:MAG: tetratricopeptide repeat protein [Myxococcota bacterium]|nr:tetratricopeptide repeat protein [Myxococcota bacterium]
MLRVEPSLKQLAIERASIVRLFVSQNSPLINLEGIGVGSTSAVVVLTITSEGQFQVFAHLGQSETADAYVYVCESEFIDEAHTRAEFDEGVRFMESLGLDMMDTKFEEQSLIEQTRLIGSLAAFQNQVSTKTDFAGVSRVVHRSALRATRRTKPYPTQDSSQTEAVAAKSPLDGALSSEVFSLEEIVSTKESMAAIDPTECLPDVEDEAMEHWDDEGTGQDNGAIMRIGRLFSTFLFPLLILLSVTNCAQVTQKNKTLSPAAQTQIDIGHEHLKHSRWRAALQVFEGVIRVNGSARDAHYGAALAYIQLGQLPLAEEQLRNAIKADADWSVAKNSLASLLVDQNRCDEAIGLLEKVRADIMYPTPWYADFHFARALACRGQRAEAVLALQKLVTGRPEFCAGYLKLAEFAVVEKQFEVALRGCEQFQSVCEGNKRIKAYLTEEHSCMCDFWAGRAHLGLGDIESGRSEFLSCRSNGEYGRRVRQALELLNE